MLVRKRVHILLASVARTSVNRTSGLESRSRGMRGWELEAWPRARGKVGTPGQGDARPWHPLLAPQMRHTPSVPSRLERFPAQIAHLCRRDTFARGTAALQLRSGEG